MKIKIPLVVPDFEPSDRVIVKVAPDEWYVGEIYDVTNVITVKFDDGASARIKKYDYKDIHKILLHGQKPRKLTDNQAAKLIKSPTVTVPDLQILVFGHVLKPRERKRLADGSYKSNMDLVKTLAETYGALRTAAVLKATRSYKGMGFEALNKSLRGRGNFDSAEVQNIDLYVKHAHKSSANIVYRAVGAKVLSKLKVGETFTDRAFMSTSTDRAFVEKFSKARAAARGGILKITGVKNVGVSPWQPYEDRESEVILPRGSTFQVVSNAGELATLKYIRAAK